MSGMLHELSLAGCTLLLVLEMAQQLRPQSKDKEGGWPPDGQCTGLSVLVSQHAGV